MWASLGLALSLIFISACTSKDSSTVATGGRVSPTYQGPAETSYCSSAISYSGSTTTVSGTATYTRRNPWGTLGSGSGGLGGSSTSSTHAATNLPIRRAEVRVTDAAGGVVQCAETSNTGTFSFVLPQGSTTYTVSINSRSNNSYLVASVLNQPEQNLFYSLQTTVTPTGATAALGTLTATATGDVISGAFNILDQLLLANEFLRTYVGTCVVCGNTTFTTAPKVVAYWTKGFNPNSYFGSTSGLSFYLPGYSRLYILGGQNGDVNSSDTDHFDNSVIIHEYGHFLEDSMFQSDSPGGSHNGDKVIDPRLAWSEGWGNFFQAAVRNQALYIDTLGNDDGSTHLIYYANLETASSGNDLPTAQGEGNFREFSVTRMLWDAIDANADTANAATDNVVSSQFDEIWASLTKGSNGTDKGFNNSNWAFRNVGHVHYAQQALAATDWSTIRTIELQDGNTGEYANYVTTSGACTYSLTPVSGGASLSSSDLFRNNNFYHVKITSTATYTFRLDYSDSNGAGTEADLDLYLYNESARFGTSADTLKYSRATPDGNVGTAQVEEFQISLSPGNYLLNVNAYVGGTTGTAATYTLKLNGVQLCPGTL